MTNSLIRIWIHAIFSTKDIMPLIRAEFEEQLYDRIKNKIENEYKSFVKNINATENHIHILMMLNPVYSFSDIMKNIKGESSHWINQNNLTEAKFSWQKIYIAYSVSESMLYKVDKFISNQKKFTRKFHFQRKRKCL